jgi:hypothetical protein
MEKSLQGVRAVRHSGRSYVNHQRSDFIVAIGQTVGHAPMIIHAITTRELPSEVISITFASCFLRRKHLPASDQLCLLLSAQNMRP